MYRPYNSNVLIGNWYEDRVLEEALLFLGCYKGLFRKRSGGQLYSQKFKDDAASQQVTLTTVSDGRIHIGDRILLKCDGNLDKPSPLQAKAYRKDCYLTSSGQNVAGITSPVLNPYTVLTIKSVDGSPEGSAIKYGQPFAITTLDGSLYLHSDTRSFERAARNSQLQIVDFVSVYNHECDWVTTCLNPKFRLEAEGNDILANEKIILLHMKTNKALAVVTDFNHPSSFEIVANTFLDSHKAEEDVNHWKFVTNIPEIPVPDSNYR